jgi:glycosyltransferase involved in cell wall biosynthesis
MPKKEQNICIITAPLGENGVTPLSNLVQIVKNVTANVYIISGWKGYEKFCDMENIKVYSNTDHIIKSNLPIRILKFMKIQLKTSYHLIRLRKDIKTVIFFIGGEGMIFPALTAKLLRKKTLIVLTGSPLKVSEINKDPLTKILNISSKFLFKISDKIVVYSRRIIHERKLENYEQKIIVGHEHFLNLKLFKIKTQIDKRKNLIGYIGALAEIKGIENFIQAIPEILTEKNNFKFILIGDGPLMDKIKEFRDANHLQENIILTGWINHNDLPRYLNEFKLLILPSYTEGLPNVILEAMACGTPVITTNVGAIPDIIQDEHTGFIMDDNSEETIRINITRALQHPQLNVIVQNANILVNKEFNYNNTLNLWKKILQDK